MIKINWKYFFGVRSIKKFDNYYKAIINGYRVEKKVSNRSVKYAIGNIDVSKKKFKTEKELIDAVS